MSPVVPHYMPPTTPTTSSTSSPKPPQAYVPQMRPTTPVRTGILDEGVVRRGPRKSMFTFQEKPKVAPNPELLSLVQGVDERKKQRPGLPPGGGGSAGGSQADSVPEEELLALGAEASNFMASKEAEEASAVAAAVVEEMAPAWTSCLKSSRAPPPGRQAQERKPEQNLSSNVSGKGAELFSRRQARMEKYVVDNPPAVAGASAGGVGGSAAAARRRDGQIRSPSPTMSLPPSWIYPSNMPGRVKAMANDASNISEQITKTLKAQQQQHQARPASSASGQGTAAARPVPQAAPQSPVLENGCTRMEMELSKHQPYQLNSSLFIFSPTKDPLSTLPRGAPPPKTVLRGAAGQPNYLSRQSSLPTHAPSPTLFSSAPAPGAPGGYRPSCFSPTLPLSPRVEVTSPVAPYTPERVMSPRAGAGAGGQAQAPRPTFSARKAGIEAQVWKPSYHFGYYPHQ